LRRALSSYRLEKATLPAEPAPEDERRLAAAWDAVLAAREVLIVLREGIGLRQHDSIDEQYGILFGAAPSDST
jgi:hypothetical protein